jgi:hypothetical protein
MLGSVDKRPKGSGREERYEEKTVNGPSHPLYFGLLV